MQWTEYILFNLTHCTVGSKQSFVFYDVPSMCFGMYCQGLLQAKTCRRDIINDKCLFFTDCMQFVGLNTAIISECYIL